MKKKWLIYIHSTLKKRTCDYLKKLFHHFTIHRIVKSRVEPLLLFSSQMLKLPMTSTAPSTTLECDANARSHMLWTKFFIKVLLPVLLFMIRMQKLVCRPVSKKNIKTNQQYFTQLIRRDYHLSRHKQKIQNWKSPGFRCGIFAPSRIWSNRGQKFSEKPVKPALKSSI